MKFEMTKNAMCIWNELMTGVNEKPKYKNPNARSAKKLIKEIEKLVYENNEPTEVVFGTSGWRGIVGASHTVQNMLRVTEALVAIIKNANKKLLKSFGIKSFEEFQRRGVVVGRDNRFMGEKFDEIVIGVLQKYSIKVFYAGEAPTPEYSAAVIQLNAALSINLTPSHNPGCYAGYKINPSDGGPAGEDITGPLEKKANEFMKELFEISEVNWKKVKKIDSKKLYMKHIKENIPHIFNPVKIKNFLKKGEVSIVIDHVHGSTRKRPLSFLGLTGEEEYVKIFNEDDNILFHGIKPEPSEKNLRPVEKWLNNQNTKYKIGVLLDPDGDRIRFTNGKEQVDMNNFGALAFNYLCVEKQIKGGVAKTVATSNFVNSIAEKLKRKIYETNVGFKYFRPFLKINTKKPVVCSFEESDGFSIGYANILEKDAFGALMLSLEIIRTQKMDLVEYLNSVKQKYGIFIADKSSVEVDINLTKDAKNQKVKNIAEQYKIGDELFITKSKSKKIAKMFPDDGIKFEFKDSSTLLLRASGTEPIIKVYAESPLDVKDSKDIKEFGLLLVNQEFSK